MRNTFAVAVLLSTAVVAHGASGFSYDFNGTSAGANPTLAETGFSGAFNFDAGGLTLGGGTLTTRTLGGDSFGNYENDPDSAKNWLYNDVDVGAQTIATAKLTVSGLSENFHGGGIWMGTDQDHYARLGVYHNGGVAIELLRENEDRWTGANPGNPGDDISFGTNPFVGSTSLQPLTVFLRLTRTGNSVAAEYSLDGVGYNSVGTIAGFALPGNTTGVSNTIESNTLKAGIYTAGGANASFAFDSLVVTPEPASLAALALSGLLLRRRR
jgi:hypothetical protein